MKPESDIVLNFCTLFDSNYLAKGLVLYYSLKQVSNNFHLYIFAFDNITYSLLKKMQLENVNVISLSEFEDVVLLNVKTTRTKAEYCWTCTPSTIHFCLKNFNIDHCTYLDADLYFFQNPKVLIDEMGDKDVLITEHRYTPVYDRSLQSGKYCVQFMCFRNTPNGNKILNWWRDECLIWCYARIEEGKFGDQKYLDDWTERFSGVHVLNHLGGGVAPWNVQQYTFMTKGNGLNGIVKTTNSGFELVFYHFHRISNQRINFVNEFYIGPYLLNKNVIETIYKPYIENLKKIYRYLESIDASFDSLGSKVISFTFLRTIAHIVWNFFRRNKVFWLS